MKPLAFGFRLSAFLLDHVDYQQSTVLRPKAEGRISSFLLTFPKKGGSFAN